MKKRLIVSFALAIFLGIGAQSAHAATVTTFFPGSVVTSVGEDFDLPILINPHGVKNYSAALQVNYPADLVTVTGFTFGDKAIRLTVDEYDSINNTSGTLIKAAGFPGGITETAIFGTIHFRAKKAGSAAVLFGANSKALDVNNQNVLQPDNTINAVITIHPATVTGTPALGIGSNTSSSGGSVTSGASSNSGAGTNQNSNTVISPAASASPSPELTGVGGPEEGTFGSDNSQLEAAAGAASSTASSIFAGKGTAIAIGLVILIIIIGIIYGASRGA